MINNPQHHQQQTTATICRACLTPNKNSIKPFKGRAESYVYVVYIQDRNSRWWTLQKWCHPNVRSQRMTNVWGAKLSVITQHSLSHFLSAFLGGNLRLKIPGSQTVFVRVFSLNYVLTKVVGLIAMSYYIRFPLCVVPDFAEFIAPPPDCLHTSHNAMLFLRLVYGPLCHHWSHHCSHRMIFPIFSKMLWRF